MVAARVNKFWFVVKVFLILLFTFFAVFIIFRKDFIMREYCNCEPCHVGYIDKQSSAVDDFIDSFCVCPVCGSF